MHFLHSKAYFLKANNLNFNFFFPDNLNEAVLSDLWFYKQQSGLDLNEDSYLNKDDQMKNTDSRYW